MRCIHRAVLTFAVLLAARTGLAAQDHGTITDVQDAKILIALEGGATPKEGDRVEIFVEIEGIGQARVAAGTVTTVLGKSALAEVQQATGTVQIGQKVRIVAASTPAPAGDTAAPATAEQTSSWLGAYVREVYRDQATAAGLDHPFGVAVIGVLDDSPASRQGLQVGDLLLTRDGQEIASTSTWSNDLVPLAPGAVLRLEIVRGGKRQPREVKLEAAPDETEIFRRVQAVADQGSAWAQYQVGMMLQRGQGVTKDESEASQWFRRAGEGGDLRGLVRLGYAYESGTGVGRDCATAATHYRTAAEAGDPDAQAGLGGLYWRGDGVKQDDQQSLKWNRMSAEQGCARGERQLAILYQTGRGGVEKDLAEAARWCLKAAIQGDKTAQLGMARIYDSGIGVPRDEAEADRWYRKLIEDSRQSPGEPSPLSRNVLAELYERGKGVAQDLAEAARLYREAAEAGDGIAAYRLGLMYSEGRGVARDDQEAAKWVRAAADNDNLWGLNRMGWLYENGLGVPQDHAEALRWYRKAADKGSALAMSNLGRCYENGWGVAVNLTEAFQWQHRAAKLESAVGQYHVGRMIAEGKGVKKNLPTAAGWMRLAADQGEAAAQSYLGQMYEHGHGVSKDAEEAASWYRKAAAQGEQAAAASLMRLEASDSQMLQGTWVCAATTREGKPLETYVGVRAVIQGESMTWYFPRTDGTIREQHVRFRIDPQQTPKHFDWWPLDDPTSIDLRVYSVTRDELRWGTQLDFKTRPETIESARWQFMMRRAEGTK